MTNLEIALSCLSVVETIVTILLHRRMKKKLDAERKRRELIEVARAAAARYEAERKAKKYPDTRGGLLAAERDWRGD